MNKTKLYILLIVMLSMLTAFEAKTQEFTLHEVVSLALKNNREIKSSMLNVEIAEEDIRAAKSLSLPSVNVGGRYDHYFQRAAFFGFGNSGSDKISYNRIGGRDQFAALLSVEQPVFNPVAKPSIRSAYLSASSSRQKERQNAIDIIAGVKKTYLTILLLNERLKLQKESWSRNQKALSDAKALFAQGRALRVDTLRAYTSVKNLEPDILQLTHAISIQKQALLKQIGVDTIKEINPKDSLQQLLGIESIAAEDALYEEAKNNRPDLQVLALNQQLYDQQILLSKAQRLPQVSLGGQYGVQTQTNNFKFFNAYWPSVSFAGVQVSVPLFTGYKNQARIRQAQLLRQQSSLKLQDAEEALRTEVKEAIARVKEYKERMQTGAAVQDAAKISYEIIQYRYEKGVASRLELTDTELALTTAQLNYLEALYYYLVAEVELERTKGKLTY